MSKIIKVKSRQVYDSRGNPTVEAEVYTSSLSASAICPSGASTGTYEAFEKRDKNNKRYLGKSVLNAVNLINTKVSKKLKGYSVHDQERIDTLMINLDGTKQKTKLGANAILAVSMAVKKLSAKIKKIPLYKTFLIKKNLHHIDKILILKSNIYFDYDQLFIELKSVNDLYLKKIILDKNQKNLIKILSPIIDVKPAEKK